MSHSHAIRAASRGTRTRPARVARFRTLFRSLSRSGRQAFRASSRRALRALRDAPLPIQFLLGAVVILAAWVVLNGVVQVIRKPTEMFFPVSGTLAKAPPETWRQYGPLFREHSTAVITPELLAALAHLCGAAWSDGYARRGFLQAAGQRCGEHDVGSYLAQVHAMRRQFVRLAAAEL